MWCARDRWERQSFGSESLETGDRTRWENDIKAMTQAVGMRIVFMWLRTDCSGAILCSWQ